MPYKNIEDYREHNKLTKRAFRKKKVDDESFKASEKARKAAWYKANKEKALENQRRYRQEKKEQLLLDIAKQVDNE